MMLALGVITARARPSARFSCLQHDVVPLRRNATTPGEQHIARIKLAKV